MDQDPIRAFFAKQYGGSIPPKLDTFLTEHEQSIFTKAQREVEWVRNLDHLCAVICDHAGTPSDCQLFWIRLWGVAEELFQKYTQGIDDAHKHRMAPGWQAVREHLCALRASFAENELALLRYMRTCQCHVTQDYLLGTPRTKFKNGQFNDSWEPFDREQKAFILRFHKDTGMDDNEGAARFATRVRGQVAQLLKVVEAWNREVLV